MTEVKTRWPVVLGVGALLTVPLVILILRRKPPPEEPPPEEPVGEQVSVEFDQHQVASGATIRANKRWRNTGVAGTRDILAAYGTGATPEAFLMEFGAVAVDQYCAAGAEVTTPVDCQVPENATPGLKSALVGVGKYTDTTMTFDDYEIVPDAIEVLPAAPPAPNIIASDLVILTPDINLGEMLRFRYQLTNYASVPVTVEMYYGIKGDQEYHNVAVDALSTKQVEHTFYQAPRYVGEQTLRIWIGNEQQVSAPFTVWGAILSVHLWPTQSGRVGQQYEIVYTFLNSGNVAAGFTAQTYLRRPDGTQGLLESWVGTIPPDWAEDHRMKFTWDMAGTWTVIVQVYSGGKMVASDSMNIEVA